MDRQQLADQMSAKMRDWIEKARAEALTTDDIEDWNNPMCQYFYDEIPTDCTLCPLEGKICEALQRAYNAAHDGTPPLEHLKYAETRLGPALAVWAESEDQAEPSSDNVEQAEPV